MKTIGGVILTREIYSEMTLVELKNKAKELGIKNISKLKKSELIDELVKVTPNAIEKNGVVLREKIAPKVKEQESINSTYNNFASKENANNMTEEQLVSSALKFGIKVYPISKYYNNISTAPKNSVILGYSSILIDNIEKGIALLYKAWFK